MDPVCQRGERKGWGAAGTWIWVDPANDLYFIGMIQRFAQNGPDVDFRGTSRAHVYDALK